MRSLTCLSGDSFYLTADVHLDPGGKRLPLFREVLRGLDAPLVVLGDLFDFWYETRGKCPGEFRNVVAGLGEAVEGKDVWLVPGNRDFLAGGGLEEVGVKVAEEALHLSDIGVLCVHGDALGAGDGLFRAFRFVTRSGWFRFAAGLVPGRAAGWLAGKMAYRKRSPGRKGVLDRKAAGNALLAARCRTLVMGHFHPRSLVEYVWDDGRLAVLPCWEDLPLVVKATSGGLDPVWIGKAGKDAVVPFAGGRKR